MTTSLTTRVSTDATYAPTVKGSPLSSAEIDNNFISLATNKVETSTLSTTATNNSVVQRTSTGGIDVKAITATALTISGGALPTGSGGTGQTTYTAGQILIGTTGGSLAAALLQGTSYQISVTSSSGSIQLSLPQDIASSSNVQHGSLGIGTAGTGTSGEIVATNQITSYYSDERLKENIELIPNALSKVNSLRGVTYNANQLAEKFGYTNKEKQVGVLAADIEKVLPEAVRPAPFDTVLFEGQQISRSGENYKTVQYEKIVPLLIEAIKELSAEVNKLKGIN